MGVTLPASARRYRHPGAVSPVEARSTRDLPQLVDLLGAEPVEQVLAHRAHVPGRGRRERREARVGERARVLRRSSGQGRRRTQPLRSSLLTACESRLCELWVIGREVAHPQRAARTSESIARIW